MNPTHGWGLSFPEALKEGARLAGLSPALLRQEKPPKNWKKTPTPSEDKSEKIARARYYYQSAEPIKNTLGE